MTRKKGSKLSEEHKDNIRQSLLDLHREMTPDAKEKLSASKRGKPRSEETKAKIRAALKGRKRPQEVVDRIKATKAANPWVPTDENRKNISDGIREAYRRKRMGNTND